MVNFVRSVRIRQVLLLCLTVGLSSCIKDVNLPFPVADEQITLNGLLHPDSLVSVSLTQTRSINDAKAEDFELVSNATINLFENNELVGALEFQDSLYTIDYYPLAGRQYAIEAVVPGYGTLRATDVVPAPPEAAVCFREDTANIYMYANAILDISITDPSSERNAYWLDTFSSRYTNRVCSRKADGYITCDTMKKFILISLLAACSFPLLAQVSVGLKIGGALSNQADGGVLLPTDNGLKPTYLGGVFATAPLSESFSLQPEVLYVNKGFQTISSGPTTPRYNLHYLSIPIMLRYHILDKLTVELGPEISYLMDATTNRNFTGSFSGSPSFNQQLLASYKDLDLALNIGVGYLLSDRFSVGLRYNMGLYDVSKDFTVSLIGQEELVLISGTTYNRSLQLSVGYRLF